MIKQRILLLLGALVSFIIPYASATQIMAAGSALTLSGNLGLLVDLGFENSPGMTIAMSRLCYRLISFGIILSIGMWVDSKNTADFCIFTTCMAALFAWFGWFTVPVVVNGIDTGAINPAGPWAVIILCAVLSVAMYITDSKQKHFGASAFSDPVIAIVTYLMFLQIAIAIVSGTGIFASTVGVTIATPSVCGGTDYTNCMIDGNAQLTNLAGNSLIGSTISSPFSLIATAVTSGWSALIGILQLILSLVAFPTVITTIFPWIASSPPAVLLLGMMGAGIWLLEILTVFRWLFKPNMGEGKL